MNGVWIVIAASALLGLATGLIFRVWAMLIVSPLVAAGTAIVLYRESFGFVGGVITIVVCLFVCQAAYLAATKLLSPHLMTNYLAEDALDDDPGEDRER